MGLRDKFTSSPMWDVKGVSPQRRRSSQIALAAILLVVGVIAALLWWSPWSSPDHGPVAAPTTASTAPSAVAPTQAPPSSSSSERSCAGDDADGAATAAPPVQRWELKTTAYVPINTVTGPCEITGNGVPAGFSRSDTGALFAAQWYAGVLDVTGVIPGWKERIESAVVEGSGRTIMLSTAEQVSKLAAPAPVSRDARVQTCGYRIASYTEDAAKVELAVCPRESWMADVIVYGLELRWSGDDWKVVATIDGRLMTAAPSTGDLSDFIPWGPDGFAGLYR